MKLKSDDGCGTILFIGLICFGAWWWYFRDDPDVQEGWTGYVYPDASLETWIEIGQFSKFEQCQQSSINVLRGIEKADVGSYECGLDCSPSASFGGINVCKETRR